MPQRCSESIPILVRSVRILERLTPVVCMETAYSCVGILHGHLGDLRIGVAYSPVRLGRGAEKPDTSVSLQAYERAK